MRMRNVFLLAGVVVVVLGVAAVDQVRESGPLDLLSGSELGAYGSAHRHLYMRLTVGGERANFSRERYQLRSELVHFENGDGEVVHVHAEGVTVGFTLKTLGIRLEGDCLTWNRTVCTNATHALRVYVNGQARSDAAGYVLQQDDAVWVWYGSKDERPDPGFFERRLPERYRPEKPGTYV